MRILNLCFADNAGAAYSLSHALNKVGEKSINLRANNNYINYPTIASVNEYDREGCARLVDKSDVVVFHSAIMPFVQGLGIDMPSLDHKKKVLYFHGSECRKGCPELLKQADEYLGSYKVVVSTPDLLEYTGPSATWVPCIRSFTEIAEKYGRSTLDDLALSSFEEPKRNTILGHAPTSSQVKGTAVFHKAISRLLEIYPKAEYLHIENQSWDSCLRTMSGLDVFFDQAHIGAYGLAAVEASVFRIPVFAYISEQVAEAMAQLSGLENPFIQWSGEEELIERIYYFCEHPEERSSFGGAVHDYCKKVHDEEPGAKRFLEVVNCER